MLAACAIDTATTATATATAIVIVIATTLPRKIANRPGHSMGGVRLHLRWCRRILLEVVASYVATATAAGCHTC